MAIRWETLALAASVLALGPACPAQARFTATTSLVNVAFTARDEAGHLLGDLQQSDLEVADNGRTQKVAYFSRLHDVPLTIGLLLDMSASQGHSLKQHQQDLEQFLHVLLGPGDRAFLMGFGNSLRLISDFTPAPSTLVWDLSHYSHRYTYPEVGPKLDRDGGTALFDSVFYAITEKLDRQTGRRVLLLFSDGEDNASANDEGNAIAAAQDNDVTVYTIRYTESRHLSPTDQQGVFIMNRLAQQTGGETVDANRVAPATYLPAIAAELHASYELGYYAPPGKGFRTIEIRSLRPGVSIHARAGYTAH